MSKEDNTPQEPQVAEDSINEAPGYIGTLEPEEMQQMSSLQSGANQAMLRIGQLELEKVAIVAQVRQGELQARQVMNAFAERVGTSQGQNWTINPGGKVYAGVRMPGGSNG